MKDSISLRLKSLHGFSIDEVADVAGNDPNILRLENLDTDIPPPATAIRSTKQAIGHDDFNSYLPFTGSTALKEKISDTMGSRYDYPLSSNCVTITNGATEAMLNVLLALIDPGDEVIVTDPTYAGIIQRIILSGGKVVYMPLSLDENRWRPDIDKLSSLVNSRTKAIFLMNPSMPSGSVLTKDDWIRLAKSIMHNDLLLIYNATMEQILFDGLPFLHPYLFDGLAEKTITIGSVSKEKRMIGWRVGWIIAPEQFRKAFETIHIYNVVTVSGFCQAGVITALDEPVENFNSCVAQWQTRRDKLNDELAGFPVIPAEGGWSELMDCRPLGLDASTVSQLLMEKGKIAATPMTNWGGEISKHYIRLVFSNEPVDRLEGIGKRFNRAFS